jgi:hypothetical protein
VFRANAVIDLKNADLLTATAVVANQPLPRLDILQVVGWVRISRQAVLVTVNGNQATFSSRGEVNLAIQGALTAEIRRIEFGSLIRVLPLYDPRTGRIELTISADVSDLTDDRGSGIPGRTVSKLDTLVNLELGQGVMLAGLNAHTEARTDTGCRCSRRSRFSATSSAPTEIARNRPETSCSSFPPWWMWCAPTLALISWRRSGSSRNTTAISTPSTSCRRPRKGAAARSVRPAVIEPSATETPITIALPDGTVVTRFGAAVIGRDPSCDIVLASGEVSRRHAAIEIKGGAILLTDNSANGTLVNGQLVVRATIPVDPTAALRIGPYDLLLKVNPYALASVEATPNKTKDPGAGVVSGELRRRIHRQLLDNLDLVTLDRKKMDDPAMRPKVQAALRRIVASSAPGCRRGPTASGSSPR